MSNNTRSTRSSRATVTRSEFNALKSEIGEIKDLIVALAPAAPKATTKARATRPARKARATKATTRTTATKVVKDEAPASATCLTRKTRPAFVKANPQFAGKTTGDIQKALIEGASVEGNWIVGPRTLAFLETGVYPATEPKAGKKGKKAAKATKAPKAAKVTATVEPKAKAKRPAPAWSNDGLEYGSEAWIKATPPYADEAPKTAKGGFTRKATWGLRCRLHESGAFSVEEIDNIVAAGV